MPFHQPHALLKHYGFKATEKIKGPHWKDPQKHPNSLLKSTWVHPALPGKLKMDHATKSFVYLDPGLQFYKEPEFHKQGKECSILENYVKKLLGDTVKISFPDKEMKIIDDPKQTEKQAESKVQKTTSLFPSTIKAIEAVIATEKAIEAVTAKEATALHPLLEKHKLVAQYVHKQFKSIIYTFNPVTTQFESSQGKTFTISTIMWMLKQDIIVPLGQDTSKKGDEDEYIQLDDPKLDKIESYPHKESSFVVQEPFHVEFNAVGNISTDNFKKLLAYLKEQQSVDFSEKFDFDGSAMSLGGAHKKYFLTHKKTGQKYLFKPALTIGGKKASLLAYADKLAADIGEKVLSDSQPPVFIGSMTLPNIGKQFGSFQPYLSNLKCLDQFSKEQLDAFDYDITPQIQQLHVMDWLISNHDAHIKHFVVNEDGWMYGIDKTQAYKFFPDDQLSTMYHPNTQEAAPYYNSFFTQHAASAEEWNSYGGNFKLDPSEIFSVVANVQKIPDKTFKRILAPYAAARYKNVDEANLFLIAACNRKKNIKAQLEAFYGVPIPAPKKLLPITKKKKVDPASPEALVNTLVEKGYAFHSYGAKTNFPKYKDAEGKTVYLTGGNEWEYYPMGSSSMNPYGSVKGQGTVKLLEALNQPFEKPETPEHSIHQIVSQWSGEQADKFHALPTLDVKKLPEGYATGGDPVSHITVTGKFTKEEIDTIKNYKGSGYHSINQFLYAGQEAHGGSYLANHVKHLQSALTKSKTKKNLVLWRGLQHNYSDLMRKQLLEGDVVLQPNSFQSCSTSQNFSHSWTGGHAKSPKVVLMIHVKAGTCAVAPNSVTNMYVGEKELILSHNVVYHVKGLYQYSGNLYAEVTAVFPDSDATKEEVKDAIKEEGSEELIAVTLTSDSGSDTEKITATGLADWLKMAKQKIQKTQEKDAETIWVSPTVTKKGHAKAGYFKKINKKKV